jgi:hypothetical protein
MATDPRHFRTLLGIAKEFSRTFQELELEHDGLKLHVKFTGAEPAQAKPAKVPAAVAAAIQARKKADQEVRPAIASLSEKTPLFDWGLKS